MEITISSKLFSNFLELLPLCTLAFKARLPYILSDILPLHTCDNSSYPRLLLHNLQPE